jgi:predicted transcriptional regulator
MVNEHPQLSTNVFVDSCGSSDRTSPNRRAKILNETSMENLIKPTDAELDILKVLWTHGPCTVRQVHEHLESDPPRGYTTILKLLQIMSDKRLVRRNEKQRAHVYEAAVTSDRVHRKYLRHLLDRAFDNSTSKLVMQALAAKPASKEELAEIRRMLDEIEGDSK